MLYLWGGMDYLSKGEVFANRFLREILCLENGLFVSVELRTKWEQKKVLCLCFCINTLTHHISNGLQHWQFAVKIAFVLLRLLSWLNLLLVKAIALFLNKQNISFLLTNKSQALYFLWAAKPAMVSSVKLSALSPPLPALRPHNTAFLPLSLASIHSKLCADMCTH